MLSFAPQIGLVTVLSKTTDPLMGESTRVLSAPRRIFPQNAPGLVARFDGLSLTPIPTPAQVLGQDLEQSVLEANARHSQRRLGAMFVLGEDPQRRFENRAYDPMLHQLSLVKYIVNNQPRLR